MSYCIINCTTENKEDAQKLAKHLISKKLIACCNIIPSITSIYEWDNKLNTDEEALMIMKTRTELYEKIEAEIKKYHKYEVPEIICIKINGGSKEYLDWVDKQTKKESI